MQWSWCQIIHFSSWESKITVLERLNGFTNRIMALNVKMLLSRPFYVLVVRGRGKGFRDVTSTVFLLSRSQLYPLDELL